MNTRKPLAILTIVLAIIILILIIYFLFFYNFSEDIKIFQREEVVSEEENLEERQIVKRVPDKEEKVIEAPKAEEITRSNLQKIAFSFAERFGSYSNHSDFENMTDLKVFMSEKMAVWADGFIEEARESGDYTDVYEGVVTKAISSEIKSINESQGQAEILVKTQKIKSGGQTSKSSISYEDVLIVFVKESGIWKVDSAYWQ